MKELLTQIEAALAYARETLRRVLAQPRVLDGALPDLEAAWEATESARAFLELHRSPDAVIYDPRRVLKPLLDAPDERRIADVEATSECGGDPEQVRVCLDLVLRNVVLESDAILMAELFEEEDTPQVGISFDGPGRLAEPLSFRGFLAIPLADLEARWTVATRGGRLDKVSNGLRMRLKGVRLAPESVEGLEGPLQSLRAAASRLSQVVKLARTAPASDADARVALDAALAGIEDVLAAADAPARRLEPGNLCALVEEQAAAAQSELKQRGIALETWCDRNVPPIAMVRERMQAFFANALRFAEQTLASGGSANILVDYDARARVAGLVITLDGIREPARADHWLASMRRAVTESHDGTFELEQGDSNTTITATLLDPVGKRIDAWIPGWDGFGDRSRQVLRLLQSGGPTPPAEFLLEGVLEEELERWLLPAFDAPTAVNAAHDTAATDSGLPGASPERLDKGLTQIRKRKVKKEIAQPAYAAELLWAFGSTSRGRAVLGLDDTAADALRPLCEALLRKPADAALALRLLAEVRGWTARQ